MSALRAIFLRREAGIAVMIVLFCLAVGAVKPQHAGEGPRLAAQMCADGDVFQDAHVGHQLDVLEGPGDA